MKSPVTFGIAAVLTLGCGLPAIAQTTPAKDADQRADSSEATTAKGRAQLQARRSEIQKDHARRHAANLKLGNQREAHVDAVEAKREEASEAITAKGKANYEVRQDAQAARRAKARGGTAKTDPTEQN